MRDRSAPAEAAARHPFWHAVALGMTPYAYLGFRLEAAIAHPIRLDPGILFVSTHRAETDVPLIIGVIYWRSGAWHDHAQRLHFAARDDMFARGFFAGFPPGLPGPVRRLLYPLDIARYLPMVRVHPIGSARHMKAAQALALVAPETPLDGLLPRELAEAFAARGASTAGEALSGDCADLLWRTVTPDGVPDPGLWGARTAEARRQVEHLVAVLREGGPLLLFPEGRPSPDGAVGPIQRGLGLIARRGGPEVVQPLAITYDPFVRGRTLAVVGVGAPFAPQPREVEEQVLAALRRTMPLTAGGFVAHALATAARAGRDPTTDELEEGLRAAAEDDRPVEPRLGRARLSEALGALRRRGLLTTADGRTLRLDRERLLADRDVLRLEREQASVRAPD